MSRTKIERIYRKMQADAKALGAELLTKEETFIDDEHLDPAWYGGYIGGFKYKGYELSLEVHGDVEICGIMNGRDFEYVNRLNTGAMSLTASDHLRTTFKSDSELWDAANASEDAENKIEFNENSWVEAFVVYPNGSWSDGTVVDGVDNVLDACDCISAWINWLEGEYIKDWEKMSRRLTKELVMQWLKEADGWEAGHNEVFEYKDWSLSILRDDDIYKPYCFALSGQRNGTAETISRRYTSIEEALLSVVNGFNENAEIPNLYESLGEAMCDPFGWLARVNTQIRYIYRDADKHKVYYYDVVVAGIMSGEQEMSIKNCLKEGFYFIPSRVDLPDDHFGSVTEADNLWFELVGTEPTSARPTLDITADELTAKFMEAANGWTDCLRPYSVTIQETLSRSVIVWADSREEAKKKAHHLSNDGTISLTNQDFIDRKIECSGVAQAYDLNAFKQYGKKE